MSTSALAVVESQEIIVQVPRSVYSAHPLAKTHFRGDASGDCDCWGYQIDENFVGFAVMAKEREKFRLQRVIVDESLPREKRIAIGQALVGEMCSRYSRWTSSTDADCEAPDYHEFYRVDGVVASPPIEKQAPKVLNGIPLPVADWQSREKCQAFLQDNPAWHKKIVENPKSFSHGLRPGGKLLSESELKEKLQHVKHAARMLHLACPATQIRYEYVANSLATVGDIMSHTLEVPAEQLADTVILGFKNFAGCLCETLELKRRFETGERDSRNSLRVPIKDCYSWQEFVETHLDIGIRQVRRLLAAAKTKKNTPRQLTDADGAAIVTGADSEPQNPSHIALEQVWKQIKNLVPYTGDGVEHVFVAAAQEFPNITITTLNDYHTAGLVIANLRKAATAFVVYADNLDKVYSNVAPATLTAWQQEQRDDTEAA